MIICIRADIHVLEALREEDVFLCGVHSVAGTSITQFAVGVRIIHNYKAVLRHLQQGCKKDMRWGVWDETAHINV
jgi:hypothetical protein